MCFILLKISLLCLFVYVFFGLDFFHLVTYRLRILSIYFKFIFKSDMSVLV